MTARFQRTQHYGWIINENKDRMYALAGLLLAASETTQAADNLHFYGNLLSKFCTLVVDGELLAEVHFPTVSSQDLMVAGQSAVVPVVFKLKDCKGPANYQVKVTLTGTEDSEQPGFLAPDPASGAQGIGIGMEKSDGTGCRLMTQLARLSISVTVRITSILMPGYRRKAVVT